MNCVQRQFQAKGSGKNNLDFQLCFHKSRVATYSSVKSFSSFLNLRESSFYSVLILCCFNWQNVRSPVELPPWKTYQFTLWQDMYRFRKTVGKSKFSEQFRKLINRYKRIGYILDVMRQTACLVVNPIIVDGYASLFNCTTAVRAADSMTASS